MVAVKGMSWTDNFLEFISSLKSCSLFLNLFPLFFSILALQLYPRLMVGPSLPMLMTSVPKRCITHFSVGLCHGGGRGLHSALSRVSLQTLCSCFCIIYTQPANAPGKRGYKRRENGCSKECSCCTSKERERVLLTFFKFRTEIFLQYVGNREMFV